MPARPVEAVVLRMTATSARPALDLAPADLPERAGGPRPRATIAAALANDSSAPAPAALFDREDLRPGDEIAGPAVERWANATAREHGFSDVSHTLEIFGRCSSCSSS